LNHAKEGGRAACGIMSGASRLGAEEAEQQEPQQLSLEHVVDDFSLQSQGIRFRAGREMKIYEQAHGQLILEERSASDDDEEQAAQDNDRKNKGHKRILVKSTNDRGYALSFLRAAYSLMAIFVGGFLFILGFDILLFLFIDVASKLGFTSDGNIELVKFFAVLLSVPVFVYSLAMVMTLVGRFVIDTFYGHPFLRSFGMGIVTTDWLAFVMYLGIPILAFIITLFSDLGNWWEISLLTWFASILTFWCFFSACELWLEIWACLELMEEDDGSSLIADDPWGARVKYWLEKARNGCVCTMKYRLSGKHIYFKKFVAETNAATPSSPRNIATIINTSKCANCINCISEDLASEGPYSYIANKEWNPCFNQKSPERIRTLDETLGNTYYVTRHSWSLEKLFCRSGGLHSAIPITQGESSITKAQINSNIACNLLGNVIIVLLFIGVVAWFDLTPAALGIVSIIVVIVLIWVGFATLRLWGLRKDVVNNENTTLYRYWEIYQHSMPKDHFIWAFIFLQAVFLYLLPLVYLAIENPPPAVLFAFLGPFAGLRHYLNPRILLLEGERKDYFRNTLDVKTRKERKEWKKKSRLYHLVAVGGDTARHFWTGTYLLLVIFFVVIALLAVLESESSQNDPSSDPTTAMTLVDGYIYQPQPHLPYPTCVLKKGFGGNIFELSDFAFLSGLAYKTDDFATEALNKWFGEGVATNNVELIEEFKNSEGYGEYGFGSAVSYKLITFTDGGGVLTIRGTQTAWDLMADAQLWISAILFQGLRSLLPLSELFTPILHHMVWIVTQLESKSITKVSYYRETRGFVDYLKEVKGFERLLVTGHSLGGGLAIITGAESNTSVVAISGPNAMLSRDSFIPPVTVENLNTLTFNVIPARDPVAKIDDKARLYQNINCTAAPNNIAGCHAITRSLCEIQYTCGTGDRPVLCECVLDYGYPEPSLPTTDQTTTAQQTTSFIQTCVAICEEAGGGKENCERWKEKYNK